MAERRMFAKTIIDSDLFLDMPMSTQLLYFHLAMRADDDGFINNPNKIQRMIGGNDDDMKLLILKQFILPFDSGIIVIKHWKIHNYIRSDRYRPSCRPEKKSLVLDENKVYQMSTECQPDGIPDGIPTVDVGKDRLGKERLGKDNNNIMSDLSDDVSLPSQSQKKKKTKVSKYQEAYKEIISYLNHKVGTSYRPSAASNQKYINARLNDNYTIDDFKTVIDKKCEEWIGTDMEKYLRPETLFGAKFENYLNQKTKRSEEHELNFRSLDPDDAPF